MKDIDHLPNPEIEALEEARVQKEAEHFEVREREVEEIEAREFKAIQRLGETPLQETWEKAWTRMEEEGDLGHYDLEGRVF